MTPNKIALLKKMSNEAGVIAALAIDQRGSLKKMLAAAAKQPANEEDIVAFKEAISSELTPYASAILLDPEYGLPAAKVRADGTGLLVAYEKTGYDVSTPGRLPDLISEWSVKRLKAAGADSIKFLLYYDVDEAKAINDQKQAFVERIGDECLAEDLPFFCELVSYDATNEDVKGVEYAKVKPHKVLEMMTEFSKAQYNIDVLKVEVPVNMAYVEGFNEDREVVYTQAQAMALFKAQSDATTLPYIFLSAGVTAALFQATLELAHEADAQFNGVLCGRATWKNGIEPFASSEAAGRQWLQTTGKQNIETLNSVLNRTATSWFSKVQ
ncbi:tagatose-bisphosphate aldolase [Latilactobacillus fuchuensis]|jgi:tagatose 1,6-diphosphate aldolase|uniref:Tagatose 1,6-diphosphate aldolase n=2 Tax=Latilactobacillus fuchuensis TaxID=164393 RepID=A0A2N9DVW4_9LACO|nr:tagatose-bisphosphate aldolase [Latilactobacillus fuchuensis]KRL58522.1 tagatose 1,6-diphosphate aldolase [Latilactobacillus fuchuensis DSM 14340 = JCM 11249]MCP8858378.1 tagatose-bisphosphate aldolase [Latilactobacillus fuchuensis]SPC38664.1 Tagatose 1,6-diphosphate aldolase 2 [Latilactobacillus fuchuensis]